MNLPSSEYSISAFWPNCDHLGQVRVQISGILSERAQAPKVSRAYTLFWQTRSNAFTVTGQLASPITKGFAQANANFANPCDECTFLLVCLQPPAKNTVHGRIENKSQCLLITTICTKPKMLNLFSLQQQQKEAKENAHSTVPKASPAELRVRKDISELQLPKTCETQFLDQNDLLNFKLHIKPDEGIYRGGRFTFSFKIGPNYPHEPPKVKCETRVYHPNIDMDGNVCLNILREEWKPVLNIGSVIFGVQFLFLEPNPEDPLNKEAAELFAKNRQQFEQQVARALRGGYINGVYFDKVVS